MESKCPGIRHSGGGRDVNPDGIGYGSSSFPSTINYLPKAVQPHTPEEDDSTLEDIHWGTTPLAWADHCPSEERKDRSAVTTASCG